MLTHQLNNGCTAALLDYDNNLFEGLKVPAPLVKDDVIDEIILKHGLAQLMYPDPEVMKYYITKWTARKYKSWERLVELSLADYNPLENYDRYEESEDSSKDKSKSTSTNSTATTATADGSVVNQVSAENMTDFTNDGQTLTGESTSDNSRSDGRTEDSSEGSYKHLGHLHGNIGVTRAQEMYRDEYSLIMDGLKDIAEAIADDYYKTFCLEVY